MSASLTTFGAIQDAPQTETTQTSQETILEGSAPIAPVEPIVATETIVTDPPVTEDFTSTIELSLGDEGAATETQLPSLPAYNWKEELKKVDRNELVSEFGIDPFALELDKHIKGGGQAIDYLMARAIDYNKFTDEALVKNSLAKEYPTLSPTQINLMFNRRYSVGEEASDEDREFVKATLEGEASKIRQTEINKQQQFKIADTPIPQKDEAYEKWQQDKQSQAQSVAQLKSYFEAHPSTKALNESKRVTINLGEGVAPFNFVINDPALVNRVLTDDGASWNKLTSTPQGEPDVAKQQLLTLIAFNPQKALMDIYNYGVQMGERKRVAEGQNAQRQQAKIADMGTGEKATYRTGTFGRP